jgi:P4 family phage/plasmid primase-like protien
MEKPITTPEKARPEAEDPGPAINNAGSDARTNNVTPPPAPQPDFEKAAGFVEALTGSRDAPLCFRTFDDAKDRKNLTSRLHGSLAEHWKRLVELNSAGAGVFFVVNEGGDNDASIVALRALFVDCDDRKFPDDESQDFFPNILVRSSPGKEHAYWRLRSGEPVARFRDAQCRLIAHFKSDEKIKNESRVMRLPGTVHRKSAPWFITWEATDETEPYTIDEVVAHLPQVSVRSAATVAEDDHVPDEEAWKSMGLPLTEQQARAIAWLMKERGSQEDSSNGRKSIGLARQRELSVSLRPGDEVFLMVCRDVVRGFDLPTDVARNIIDSAYNRAPWCDPMWSDEAEYAHKLSEARKPAPGREGAQGWGYLLCSEYQYEQYEQLTKRLLPSNDGTSDAPTHTPLHILQRPPIYLQRGDQAELADELLRNLGGKDAVVFDEGEVWAYQESTGLWVPRSRDEMTRIIKGFAGAQIGPTRRPLHVSAGFADGTIKLACSEAKRPGFFEKRTSGVAFSNGFVVVRDGSASIQPRSHHHRARHGFAFSYEKDLPHLRLDQFFANLFAGASDAAERVSLLQEFIGACLIGEATIYQRCLVLYGSGGNGKSEVLRLFRELFPGRAVVAVPPQQWGERFQLPRLAGVLANLVDEMPDVDIEKSEQFKSVITGDPIHTERKHQEPFEMRPIAGHVFSGNNLPGTTDQSHGYWRRFMMCPFDQNLEAASCHKVNASRDVVDHELPAVAVWALEGAARLQRQEKYTTPATATAALAEWRKSSDSVACFIDERTETAGETGASMLYERYRFWCDENGHRAVSNKKFSGRMKALGREGTRTNKGTVYPVRLAP